MDFYLPKTMENSLPLTMQLEEYIRPLEPEEYEKFLGVAGDELEKLMQENKDVLIRLKERS